MASRTYIHWMEPNAAGENDSALKKKGEVLWEWGTQSIPPFTSGAPLFHAQVTPQVLTGPPDN